MGAGAMVAAGAAGDSAKGLARAWISKHFEAKRSISASSFCKASVCEVAKEIRNAVIEAVMPVSKSRISV